MICLFFPYSIIWLLQISKHSHRNPLYEYIDLIVSFGKKYLNLGKCGTHCNIFQFARLWQKCFWFPSKIYNSRLATSYSLNLVLLVFFFFKLFIWYLVRRREVAEGVREWKRKWVREREGMNEWMNGWMDLPFIGLFMYLFIYF